MAWTDSRIFRSFLQYEMLKDPNGAIAPGGYTNLVSDTVKVALFNNSATPDRDAAITSTGYNTGTWTTGNEVTDATNWVAGGRVLAGDAYTASAGGVVMYDATDLSGGGTLTLAATYGCLCYDDTITAGTGGVADQGFCFNYFGGAQQVTAGTFTVIWNANGIFRFTV